VGDHDRDRALISAAPLLVPGSIRWKVLVSAADRFSGTGSVISGSKVTDEAPKSFSGYTAIRPGMKTSNAKIRRAGHHHGRNLVEL